MKRITISLSFFFEQAVLFVVGLLSLGVTGLQG